MSSPSDSLLPGKCHGVLLTEIKLRSKVKGAQAVSFTWNKASSISTADPRQPLPSGWSHQPYFVDRGGKTYLGLRPLDRAFEDLLSGYEQRYKEPGSDLSAIRYMYVDRRVMTKAQLSHAIYEDVNKASNEQNLSLRFRFSPTSMPRVQEVEIEFTQTPVDFDEPGLVTPGLDGASYGPAPGDPSEETVQHHVLDDLSKLPVEEAAQDGESLLRLDGTADALVEMWSAQNLAWERVTSCRYADLANPSVNSAGWMSRLRTFEHQGSTKTFMGPQATQAQWAEIIGKHLPRNFDPKYAALTSNRFGSKGDIKDMGSACQSIQKSLQPTTSVFQEGDDNLRIFSLRSKHFSGQEEVCFRLRLEVTSRSAGQSYNTPAGTDYQWTG